MVACFDERNRLARCVEATPDCVELAEDKHGTNKAAARQKDRTILPTMRDLAANWRGELCMATLGSRLRDSCYEW